MNWPGQEYENDHQEIFDDHFPIQDLTYFQNNSNNNPHLQNYQLGTYERCCISCGQITSCFCILCNSLTCCMFLKKGGFSYNLPTHQSGIVEQFGRFTRMLKPGFNFLNPCTEELTTVDMRIKSFLLGKQSVLTRDNISLTIETAVYYRIINPIQATYRIGLDHIQLAIREAAFDVIRNSFGEHSLDQILTTRNQYIQSTRFVLQNKLVNQGILIQNVFLTELSMPASIQQNLASTAKQKRLSEARIISSLAKVETAKLMKQSSQILSSKSAMQIRYLQMLQELGNQGKNITIMIPIGVNSVGKAIN